MIRKRKIMNVIKYKNLSFFCYMYDVGLWQRCGIDLTNIDFNNTEYNTQRLKEIERKLKEAPIIEYVNDDIRIVIKSVVLHQKSERNKNNYYCWRIKVIIGDIDAICIDYNPYGICEMTKFYHIPLSIQKAINIWADSIIKGHKQSVLREKEDNETAKNQKKINEIGNKLMEQRQ